MEGECYRPAHTRAGLAPERVAHWRRESNARTTAVSNNCHKEHASTAVLTGTAQLDICLESNPTANLFLRARTHYNSIYGPRHRTSWTACRGRSAAGTLAAAMPPSGASNTNSSTDSRRCTPPTHTHRRAPACIHAATACTWHWCKPPPELTCPESSSVCRRELYYSIVTLTGRRVRGGR